ncbi:ORF6N domain protein [compost metagenome]
MNISTIINDKKILIINYQSINVLTTEMLAELYRIDKETIRRNFLEKSPGFVEGVHYLKVEDDDLQKFKASNKELDLRCESSTSLILWTKRGTTRHAQILDTDEIWDTHDIVSEKYFDNNVTINIGPHYLLTIEGAKAALDFTRNLAAQVFIGSISIVFTVRALETGNWPLGILSVLVWIIFLYIVIANFANFLSPILKNLQDQLVSIDGYVTKKESKNMKFLQWGSTLFKNILLVAIHKPKIFFELLIIFIILEIPPTIVLFSAGISAGKIYDFFL